jgi:hypothetical protein
VRFEVTPSGVEVNATKGSWLKGGYHELELSWFLANYLAALRGESVDIFGAQTDPQAPRSPHPVPPTVPKIDWHLLEQESANPGLNCYRFFPVPNEDVGTG